MNLPAHREKEDNADFFFLDTRLKKSTCPGKRGHMHYKPKIVMHVSPNA